MAIHIGNAHLRLRIGDGGEALDFRHVRSDTPACVLGAPFARIRRNGRLFDASSAAESGGCVRFAFGDSGISADLKLTSFGRALKAEVVALQGGEVEELVFLDLPLALTAEPDDPFSACALALNLRTKIPDLPGPSRRLRASCYPRFGFAGAAAAIVVCPTADLRAVIREVVDAASDLPRSSLWGPRALEAPINRGSYLFNFEALTEETVGDWIRLMKALGFTQLDFHGGKSFRFGDCLPNPAWYPHGRTSLKAVIDRLHAEGLLAGLHTYAFFLDKQCPWVTPKPDPRLAHDAVFTLAADLGAEDAAVPVRESTAAMSAVTGFNVRNSTTLQIGEELIEYAGVAREAPFAFTACRRGALGTRAAAHPRGAPVRHLKECFGLFVPDPDSTLFTEVAAATADTFNACGFDMIYFDALDGEDILAGAEHGWHYGSQFVFEVCRRLARPALIEMSTFHHHLWFARSRMGAWDFPVRSHKRFIDRHARVNEACARMFLPAHLGWWTLAGWKDVQSEPVFGDDLEYLCGKCLATDSGLSLMGITPSSFADNPSARRHAGLIRRYETLRLSGRVPEAVKALLKQPGVECRLGEEPDGRFRLRRVEYVKHTVQAGAPGALLEVVNRFGRQPLSLRLETLYSAAAFDGPENQVLADFADLSVFSDRQAADGVEAALAPSADRPPGAQAAIRLSARRTAGAEPGRGSAPAWAKWERTFSPLLDLGDRQALGVWVHGDGLGEVLNLQVQSPQAVSGAVGDHHAVLDFTGWRYLELIETEGERIDEDAWPYSDRRYAVYRERVRFDRIGRLSLWLNRLPADGREVRCRLGPIRALKLVKTAVREPSLTIGGRTIRFPAAIETGCALEFQSLQDCRLFGPDGEELQAVPPEGAVPILEPGPQAVQFHCAPGTGPAPRVRLTLRLDGEPVYDETLAPA